MAIENYTPYQSLPPLAGLASFDEARTPGLSVDECVRRLKRFHYAFRRLHEIFIARLTAEPIYELKMAFSLHGHYCAEHATALRARVGEMREPPLGLEVVPDANLEIFFDEILAAPDTAALLLGLYEKVVPELVQAMERYSAAANPLADAPSRRVLRFALLELGDMPATARRPSRSSSPPPSARASRSGLRCSIARSRPRERSTAPRKSRPHAHPVTFRRSRTPTTACRSATSVSPIPTTWA